MTKKKADPKPYTEKQFKEFDTYSWKSGSYNQMDRIEGRLGLMKMVKDLGKDICDIMWERCKAEDAVRRKRTKKDDKWQ